MPDTTFLSKKEIDEQKSIFTTCKHCGAKFSPFNPADDSEECDGCFTVRMLEQIGNLELQVSRGYMTGTWQCTLKDWDLGVPIGMGNTIQESIDDFLEIVVSNKDIEPKHLQHQYTWS